MYPIHKNYLLLTVEEKTFVDWMFGQETFHEAHIGGVPLNNGDPAERAVEAVATWVIESRPKVKQNITGNGFTDAEGNAILPFRSSAFAEHGLLPDAQQRGFPKMASQAMIRKLKIITEIWTLSYD